jgi:hypothetical protein
VEVMLGKGKSKSKSKSTGDKEVGKHLTQLPLHMQMQE